MSGVDVAFKKSSRNAMEGSGFWLPENPAHQSREFVKSSTFVEVSLSLVCLGLVVMLFAMPGSKMAVLNLFFLPIALAGFALGRYRAGVLALFCVLGTSIVASLNLADFTWAISTSVAVLSLAVWAAVLGLAAILIGTLGDDRKQALNELHEAYVGVVEVLSQYLQGANPRLRARSSRMAQLAQQVAVRMRLSPGDVDDIRVASLLYDIGRVEITTRVMRRAIDTLEGEAAPSQPSTFRGLDLMLSLGSVLRGAIPLLLCLNQGASTVAGAAPVKIPLGAEIIRTTRAYCDLVDCDVDELGPSPAEAIHTLRYGSPIAHNPCVLDVLESVTTD